MNNFDIDIHLRSSAATLAAFVLLLSTVGSHASESTNNYQRTPCDLVTPAMTLDAPGAGKRIRQVAPEYEGTEVYHALYLPVDWKPGGNYPVIVEYTGNQWAACGSSGEVKDANLGYGMSGGKGFIWVSMPYIEKGKTKNAVTWWGDRQATVDYCKVNLPRICKQFGGDPSNLFLCGFSRGAIAASYIGLADDEIAAFWKGFFTHDHFDGQNEHWGYPECDRPSALKRLARLKGRPVLVCGGGADFLKEHLSRDYKNHGYNWGTTYHLNYVRVPRELSVSKNAGESVVIVLERGPDGKVDVTGLR